MTNFIEQNAEKFNTSQLEALDRVAGMKDKDILLIQGPVSNKFLITLICSLALAKHIQYTAS
jgi:hypothetical protein